MQIKTVKPGFLDEKNGILETTYYISKINTYYISIICENQGYPSLDRHRLKNN